MKLFCIALVFLISCKPASQSQSVATADALGKIALTELGEKSVVIKNNSNTFAIAHFVQDGFVKYIVVRLSDNKVVRKERIHGAISWLSDMQIKESVIPGMVKKEATPDDNIKIIDLNQFVVPAK